MTTKITWNAENKKKLLACSSIEEMKQAFPTVSSSNLDRRAREFKANTNVRAKVAFGSTVIRSGYVGDTAFSSGLGNIKIQSEIYRNETTSNKSKLGTNTHIVIPDTQAGPNRPTDHLSWIGNYIVDHFSGKENVKIIHLGDHADMPSLSSYDRGKKSMENRRVLEDIAAANNAFDVLNKPLINYNKNRENIWIPERHITLGNHENRIIRATEDDPQIEGILSLDLLNYENHGWEVHPFMKPIILDGVTYAHYFANPMTGKPYGGMAATRLKTIGTSFTMGHQQTLDYALRFVGGKSHHALICGAAYLHSEDYKGYQGNAHWRGIVICHDVKDGSYDSMFVSLNYLCRRYENMEIEKFMKKKYKIDFNGGWN